MAEQSAGTTRHISVLLEEVVESFRPLMPGMFLDCTLGGGGHTKAILEAHPQNRVTALDRDSRAIERSIEIRSRYADRFAAVHAPFSAIKTLFSTHRFNGVLADLGVSTDQLKEGRGFSFRDDAPLDMRMDERQEISAGDIVNSFSEQKLFVLLKQGGVGQEARRVARAIVNGRPFARAIDLGTAVSEVLRGEASKSGAHPATVVFQAIRIAVNTEIGELEAFLEAAPNCIHPGGRLSVITFHSLEDRIVTSKMRQWEGSEQAPAWWPGGSAGKKLGRCVSRKAVVPSAQEIDANPSSRSARLRVFEFLNERSENQE